MEMKSWIDGLLLELSLIVDISCYHGYRLFSVVLQNICFIAK